MQRLLRVAVVLAVVAVPAAGAAANGTARAPLEVRLPPPGTVTIVLFAAHAQARGAVSGAVSRPKLLSGGLPGSVIVAGDVAREQANHRVELLGVLVASRKTTAGTAADGAPPPSYVHLGWAPRGYSRPAMVAVVKCTLGKKTKKCT